MRGRLAHPANRRVLHTLRPKDSSVPALTPLSEIEDPYVAYFECGSHPDVVKYVWEGLGKSLPEACCCLVYGTPALVHDQSGVVLAVCYGTEYALRVPEQLLPRVLKAGCTPVSTWGGVGEPTDLRTELGPDWLFGCFARGERRWTRAAYHYYRVSG
jgi:hypothetical protein